MTQNNDLPQEYHDHALSLGAFLDSIVAATATQDPIPYDTCLQAWVSLVFAFNEMQVITASADARIDDLQNELGFAYLQGLPAAGTA